MPDPVPPPVPPVPPPPPVLTPNVLRPFFLIRAVNGWVAPRFTPYRGTATGINFTQIVDEYTAFFSGNPPGQQTLVDPGIQFEGMAPNTPYHIEFTNILPGYYLAMPDFQVSPAFLAGWVNSQMATNFSVGQFALGINHIFSNPRTTNDFTINLWGGRPRTSGSGFWIPGEGFAWQTQPNMGQKHPLAGVTLTLTPPGGPPQVRTTNENGTVTFTGVLPQVEYDLVADVPLPEGVPLHFVFSLPASNLISGYFLDIHSNTNRPQQTRSLAGVFYGYIGGQGNNIQIGDDIVFNIPTRNIQGHFRVGAVSPGPTPNPGPNTMIVGPAPTPVPLPQLPPILP